MYQFSKLVDCFFSVNMETIAIHRWKLQIDPEATRRAFSDVPTGAPESCGCGDCLNFAAARDRAYPSEVLAIFEQLGIDRSKESEIWHTHRDELGLHHYGGFFHFVGAIEDGKDAMVMVISHGTYDLKRSVRGPQWIENVDSRMDHSVEYKRLIEIYETTYGESDEHLLSQTLNQLIKELGCLTSAQPKNSDAFHLLGLCWYELPKISADTLRHAEKAFRDALAIDPEHQYANLFLGHVLFDTMRYGEADQRFAMIDPEFFIARTQQWRVVKNDELRLCCRLELEPASVAFHELDAICQRYETDRELPVPGEIVSCLDHLVKRGGLGAESLQKYVSRVLAMLKVSDNLNVAYLQEPIMRLRNIVAQ